MILPAFQRLPCGFSLISPSWSNATRIHISFSTENQLEMTQRQLGSVWGVPIPVFFTKDCPLEDAEAMCLQMSDWHCAQVGRGDVLAASAVLI
ncbi:hypothetical protein ACE10Z_34485 [Bradyrhizobium sp. Pha-3]|uniref:hypothetical protein n=1 Tax=Bradyrhizobium sp. Pha-3 TaxID=208375 RepID=UPI0035D451CF